MTFPVASGLDFRQAHGPHGNLMPSAMSFRLPPATPFYSSQTNIAHLSKQRNRRTQGTSANPLANLQTRLLPACTSSASSSPTLSDEDSEVASVFSFMHSTANIRRLSAPADGDAPRRLTSVGRSSCPAQLRSSLSKYSPLPAIVSRSSEDAFDNSEGSRDTEGGFSHPPRLLRSKTYTVLKVAKNEEDEQKGLAFCTPDINSVDDSSKQDEEQKLRSDENSPES